MPRSHRPLTLAILALWKKLSQKEIGAEAGIPQKQVSYHLKKEELDDSIYARLLRGVRARPAEVDVVTACLETLEALSQDQEMTPEERNEVKAGILEGTRVLEKVFSEAVRRSRDLPPVDGYPRLDDLEASRWQARELWSRLRAALRGPAARGGAGGPGVPDLGAGGARLRGVDRPGLPQRRALGFSGSARPGDRRTGSRAGELA